ncbi:MAG TPA: glutathione S-transferase family protein [Hyphomonadaceae bacterium]|nr:glutathione S-transferase family protein [Hyphomonadaceae bacterium]
MSYRLFGAETSAYSTKMRAYLKYKGVPFDWTPRTQETEAELRTVSRFPTLPVLVTSSGFAVHDTTPLIEALEADSPEPSATPADPATAFLACVLEEYGDAWLAKAAYHYRWTRKKDQRLAAQRTIEDYYVTSPPEDRKAAEDAAIETMTAQLKSVGLEGELGALVEKSFKRFVKLLDDHLRKHLFIFGGRPSIADFAIAGQLIQMLKDPTPAKIIEKDGEFVQKWCEFMADPKPSGPFEALEDLKETLAPIFAEELAGGFLPWAAENLESSLASHETFTVSLGKDEVTLVPLRSAARSFRELRRKFVAGQTVEALKAFTDETATTVYLLRPPRPEQQPRPMDDTSEGEEGGEASSGGGDAGAEASEPREEGEDGGRKRRRRRRRRGRGRGEGRPEGAGDEAPGEADSTGGGDDAAYASGEDSGEDEADAGADPDATDGDEDDGADA